MPTASSENRVSELNKSCVTELRLALVLLGLLLFAWSLVGFGYLWRHASASPFRSSSGDGWGFLLLGLMIGAPLFWAVHQLRDVPYRTIAFDSEGLWLNHLIKDKNLVPWTAIRRIKENLFANRMSLIGADGRLLFIVEYERSRFDEIRALVMERMTFRSPALPVIYRGAPSWRIAFALLAAACAGFFAMIVRAVPVAGGTLGLAGGVVLLASALLLGALALLPVTVTIDRDALTRNSRTFPYAHVATVSMSFRFSTRGNMIPRVKVSFTNPHQEPLWLAGLNADSVTLQRTLLDALANWRERNPDGNGRG